MGENPPLLLFQTLWRSLCTCIVSVCGYALVFHFATERLNASHADPYKRGVARPEVLCHAHEHGGQIQTFKKKAIYTALNLAVANLGDHPYRRFYNSCRFCRAYFMPRRNLFGATVKELPTTRYMVSADTNLITVRLNKHLSTQ